MRQRADGIQPHNPAMIENLLKLRCRFRIPVLGNQSFAAYISRVQTAEIKTETEPIRRQFISMSDFEALHGFRRLALAQFGLRMKDRSVGKLHKSIFRESLFQIARKCL